MTTSAPPQSEETPSGQTEAAASEALKVGTNDVWALFTRNLRQSGIYIAFVVIVALFAILTDGLSLNPANVTNIVLQYSYVLILAIGMVIVIIAGHIDLSVGSVVALTGAVSAVLVIKEGWPWWAGILAALATGVLIGAWQGFWVAYVGIPAFIVTLAGMLLFRGLAQEVLQNISLSPFPDQYTKVATGFLNGLIGGNGYDAFTLLIGVLAVAGYAVSTFRTRMARVRYQQPVESFPLFVARIVVVAAVVMWFAWQLAHARGLPIVLIILAVLILGYSLVTNRTVFGRQVYAIGGNLAAATLSGVKVRAVNFWIFVNMGVLAAVAGIVFSARSNGAQPA
ncbi:MAG: ABC transporter permease subunit, partial [Oryzihumus sp.]